MPSKSRDGGRNSQLRRLLNMVHELNRSTGLSLVQLAERYGATERTIRRDLEALQEEGLPLVAEASGDSNRKLWRLDTTDHARRLSKLVDSGHYMALRLAMGMGGPVRNDMAIFAALEDLYDKIEKVIGERGRAQLKAIDQAFLSYEKHAYQDAPPDVLLLLVGAIIEHRLCQVKYRGAQHGGQAKTFVILPLRIFTHRGASHTICYVPKHQDYITLNLQRLKKLDVLEETAQIPKDFNPDFLEQSAFALHQGGEPTRHVLRFDAKVAIYIRERRWHPSQKLVELPGGAVELTFTCGPSWEVSSWVASWRHWVHVVEPKALQEELSALGTVLVSRYSRKRKRTAAKPR